MSDSVYEEWLAELEWMAEVEEEEGEDDILSIGDIVELPLDCETLAFLLEWIQSA